MKNADRTEQLRALAAQLGVPVNNLALWDRALTHASTACEPKGAKYNYESLEFLGDAVLGLAIAYHLFQRMPDRTPGEYSRLRSALVSRRCLARVARDLNIAPIIRLGKGEELAGGRERAALWADCLEALVGAIFLDQGWETAQDFVTRILQEELERGLGQESIVWDFKSRLQHFCQAQRLPLPRFEVVRSEGPDHRKEFEVEVFVQDQAVGRGVGRSKKEAEQNAAHSALLHIGADEVTENP